MGGRALGGFYSRRGLFWAHVRDRSARPSLALHNASACLKNRLHDSSNRYKRCGMYDNTHTSLLGEVLPFRRVPAADALMSLTGMPSETVCDWWQADRESRGHLRRAGGRRHGAPVMQSIQIRA